MALLRMNVRITEDYKAFVILLQGLCNFETNPVSIFKQLTAERKTPITK